MSYLFSARGSQTKNNILSLPYLDKYDEPPTASTTTTTTTTTATTTGEAKISLLKTKSKFDLLPEQSRAEYIRRYEEYKRVLKTHKLLRSEEESALVWLELLKEKSFSASTLYSYWSCIKSCLEVFESVPASGWFLVRKWLKNYAAGKFADTAPVFTAAEVEKFMVEAEDRIFMRHKLAFGFGLYGRLRACEYTYLYHVKNDKEKIMIFNSFVFL